MKIKSKLMASASIYVLLVLVLGLIIFWTVQQENKAQKTLQTAEELRTGIFELNILTSDYVRNKNERIKDQWLIRHDSIGELLHSESFHDGMEENFILSGLEENHKQLERIFLDLTALGISENFEDRLVSQLEIESQELFSGSLQLSAQIRKGADNTQRNSEYAIVFAVIFVGIVAIGNSFFLYRSIRRPLSKLEKQSQEIAIGDFDYKSDIKTNDEFQSLSDSFNKTAEALRRIDEEHKQIDKAKTEFLSITSHELRSPMTPMQAQLQMLLGNYFGGLNKKQKDSLEIVLRNTKRLDTIIQDFLEISRAEAGRLKFKFVKASLANHVLRLKKEMDGFLSEKKITIELKLAALPMIEVDPDRVMQVLRNLVNNAKKFSPDNSTIIITGKLKQNMIEFSVSDQGPGIALKDQTKLFTPFYQVEGMYTRKAGGTGLGLAICKGIIESQNGRIWLSSREGKGTTFYFTIPLKPIRESKPIKLLFSRKSTLENKVKEVYREFLGPMAESEFSRISGELKPATIFIEINDLEKNKILSGPEASKFRDLVMASFKRQTNSISNTRAGDINEELQVIS